MKEEPQPERLRIGKGMISGYLSILFSILSLGGVVAFHFPEYFTTPDFRAVYSIDLLRWLLFACLLLAVGFALSSFLLSRKVALGGIGVLISTLAILLGGHSVEVKDFEQSIFSISLDWLLLDILLLTAIFIPMELFFPQRRKQTKFHLEWKTDLVYFAMSHLFVQFVAIAVQNPAEFFFNGIGLDGIHSKVSSFPFFLQLPVAILVADLFQYSIHRLFHANRFLWRFHAVHHSIRTIDWLAGSRLHIVDILITRAFSYIPLYVLGFSMPVFYAYVAIVALQAVAAHANTRIGFGLLKYLVVTPQYHHWHHADDPKYYNKNFAIHLPIIDRVFGTYYLPGHEWPETMGLRNEQFPKGFVRQFLFPFFSDPQKAKLKEPSQR